MRRTCNKMNKFMSHLNSYAIVAPYIVSPPPHGSIWSIFVLSTFEIDNWNSKTQKDNSHGFLQVFKGTTWEDKKLCLLPLIIGINEHPAYDGWPRPCRCHHLGQLVHLGQLRTRRVPEEQISYSKCCPGIWFFSKMFILIFW